MSNVSIKSPHDEAQRDLETFQEAVKVFEELVHAHAGLAPRPISPQVWEDFKQLPQERRQIATEQIISYVEILNGAVAEGISLLADKQLSWFAMRTLKLVPPPDLFGLISDTDFTEIYNRQGVQIFRNLEFYKLVSYSIAEMSVYTWDQLYTRDERILGQIFEQGFVKGFSGIRNPYPLEIDDHYVIESRSIEQRTCHASFCYLCPLTDKTGSIGAILSTCIIKREDHKVRKKIGA